MASAQFTNGDTNYVAKLNANFSGLDASTADLIANKQDAAEKGQANGYASLNADAAVPAAELGLAQLRAEKNVGNGYAGLDSTGKIPQELLPYLTIDGGLVDMASFEVLTHKDVSNGYAGLDSSGKLKTSEFPAQPVMATAFFPGQPAASALLLAFLPTATVTLPANLSGTRVKPGTNPTGDAVLSVRKNGAEQCTITVHSNGSFTLPTCSAITITNTDELTVLAPGSPDASLADLRLTIAGTR